MEITVRTVKSIPEGNAIRPTERMFITSLQHINYFKSEKKLHVPSHSAKVTNAISKKKKRQMRKLC